MTRVLVICALLAVGCHRGQKANAPEPPAPAQAPENPAVMAARRNAPVLDRALTANDLNTLKQFMENFRATSGKYPANINELKQAFGNEGQKLMKLVEDGDLVMTWNTGDSGVLAYDKRATVSDGMVLTTNGVQRMGANDLNRLLR